MKTVSQSNFKFQCPRCSKKQIITDFNSGGVFCGYCGFVINTKLENMGYESSNIESQRNTRRTGASRTLSRHDFGLSTVIGLENKDSKGKIYLTTKDNKDSGRIKNISVIFLFYKYQETIFGFELRIWFWLIGMRVTRIIEWDQCLNQWTCPNILLGLVNNRLLLQIESRLPLSQRVTWLWVRDLFSIFFDDGPFKFWPCWFISNKTYNSSNLVSFQFILVKDRNCDQWVYLKIFVWFVLEKIKPVNCILLNLEENSRRHIGKSVFTNSSYSKDTLFFNELFDVVWDFYHDLNVVNLY